ncbi:MAG: CDP-diacylglycerol--serine O-phosphatidyltransferase [Vicinamibacterales bacterium]
MVEPSDVRRPPHEPRKRRGVYLLPSLFTIGNMFCGYACIVYAMRGDLVTAAPFIGFAIVLDMLDGRLARLTDTTSAFGVEFDSLADVVSFGVAPAVLAYAWGLSELGRIGWAAGFFFVSTAAIRLARFNTQASGAQVDKRYFIGMPTPAAAGVVAATIFAWPYPVSGYPQGSAAVMVVLVPAALMVSTLRFRSFKTINFGWGPSYLPLIGFALLIAFITTEPRFTLPALAYGYLLSAFVEFGFTRLRARREGVPPAASA